MRCGLDKENELMGNYNRFQLVILPCDRPIRKRFINQPKYKKNNNKRYLSVGELNPGLLHDRRGYLPLY